MRHTPSYQAKKNREKGSRNQRKSRDYMICHPLQYGLLDEGRIEIVRAGIGSNDFFAIKYGTELIKITKWNRKALIDPDGDSLKTAYLKLGMYEKELKAGFDLISTPYPTERLPNQTFWVQVKSNTMPSLPYIEALKNISVHAYISKELHIWHDGASEPQIIKL